MVETPCYQSLLEVARSIGCEVVPWQLRETERGWKMDLDHLQELLAEDTQLLVVNAPPDTNRPSGNGSASWCWWMRGMSAFSRMRCTEVWNRPRTQPWHQPPAPTNGP